MEENTFKNLIFELLGNQVSPTSVYTRDNIYQVEYEGLLIELIDFEPNSIKYNTPYIFKVFIGKKNNVIQTDIDIPITEREYNKAKYLIDLKYNQALVAAKNVLTNLSKSYEDPKDALLEDGN